MIHNDICHEQALDLVSVCM